MSQVEEEEAFWAARIGITACTRKGPAHNTVINLLDAAPDKVELVWRSIFFCCS